MNILLHRYKFLTTFHFRETNTEAIFTKYVYSNIKSRINSSMHIKYYFVFSITFMVTLTYILCCCERAPCYT